MRIKENQLQIRACFQYSNDANCLGLEEDFQNSYKELAEAALALQQIRDDLSETASGEASETST